MISGVVATIRWSYYDAARLEGYTITREADKRTWVLTGRIVLADAYKLAQRPLVLVVPFTGGSWEWPILDPLPRVAGPVTARLGAPLKEIRPHVPVLSASRNGPS